MRNLYLAVPLLLLTCVDRASAQTTYFPPLTGDTWATTDPASLGWCADRIDSLYAFLDAHNTKGFIVLKDGRIVLEHYAGIFTQDSLWYWASAGKTLTSLLTGIAQEEGYLDINATTDTYLGTGWTAEPADKEALITVKNQLSMTSGLDDGVPDNHCTLDSCLQYLADAGTRWAYHNAPYTLLDPVITAATGQNFNIYFNQKIRNPTGMDGLWVYNGYDHLFFSNTRSMARYGLLALNGFVWDGDTILHDQNYVHAMTHPSQTLNNSYGYLWWLNGQSSFMLPTLQFVFPGPIMPDAPADMFNGLGKNDQLLNVAPSQGLVLVRLGNAAESTSEVSATFDNEIWQYMNALMCNSGIAGSTVSRALNIYPNPSTDVAQLDLPAGSGKTEVSVINTLGRTVLLTEDPLHLNVAALPIGLYTVRAVRGSSVFFGRLIKE